MNLKNYMTIDEYLILTIISHISRAERTFTDLKDFNFPNVENNSAAILRELKEWKENLYDVIPDYKTRELIEKMENI